MKVKPSQVKSNLVLFAFDTPMLHKFSSITQQKNRKKAFSRRNQKESYKVNVLKKNLLHYKPQKKMWVLHPFTMKKNVNPYLIPSLVMAKILLTLLSFIIMNLKYFYTHDPFSQERL